METTYRIDLIYRWKTKTLTLSSDAKRELYAAINRGDYKIALAGPGYFEVIKLKGLLGIKE